MGAIISHPSLGSYKKEFMALQHMITCMHVKPPTQKRGWAKESNTETGRSMLHDIKGTIKVNSETTWRRGTNEGEGWYHNLLPFSTYSRNLGIEVACMQLPSAICLFIPSPQLWKSTLQLQLKRRVISIVTIPIKIVTTEVHYSHDITF